MSENGKEEIKEFADKTVEKAIQAACTHFQCTKDDLEIEIITRGSTGLFGLGSKKARIKAGLKREFLEKNRSQDMESQQLPAAPARASQEPALKKDLPRGGREEVPPELIEKQLAAACDIANEILEKSGLDGKANIVEQGSKPYINISGKDLSLIIGKEGHTLDALEYIVNLCLKRRGADINYRVTVEATGYRERRKKTLISLAEKMALKARKTGKPVSLHPMPARERRIIHIALRNFKGIKTHSSGEGAGRKVVITPLRNKRRPKRNRG